MEIKIDKSSWKKVCLGDVAFEYSKRTNNPSESGLERFVGNSNIGQWDFRVKTWEPTDSVTSAMKLFEPNDYLLVRRSLYASDFRERAPRAHFAGVCSGDIITIRENSDYIADGFLIGVLNSPALWKFVVANASGSITRRIKWKDLANFEFLLPPKEQQTELANLIWSMEAVIEKESNVYNSTNVAKSSLFENMLNKHDDGVTLEKATIEGITSPTKHSCVGGPFGSDLSGKHYVEEPGVPVIRGANLSKGEVKFIDDGFVYVSSDKADSLSRNLAFRGDIVVTQRGTMGQVGLIPEDSKFDRYVVSQSQMKLKVDTDKAVPEYIYYYLLSSRSQRELEVSTICTGIPHINLGIFKKMKILIPSIKLQKDIVRRIELFEVSLKKLRIQMNKSKALQKSLIIKVF